MTSQADTASPPISRKSLGHVFLAACLLLGMSAQVLLKFATLQMQVPSDTWLSYIWIIGGLGVYALGTGFWVLCLRYLDLSYAYPFTGLTYVFVLGASWLLFDESMSLHRLLGVLAICLGVALIPGEWRGNS
jgi:drug/metabolite transporter (DMT)-like permease